MFLQQAYRTAAFISYGYMNFTKGAFLKHSKEFQNEDMAVDLTDKQCMVTGANQGIGFASAEALAARGATVHLVCRSKERGEKAVEEIKAKTGNSNVSLEVCDLSSVQQVKDFASKYASTEKPLHILVNNAGSMTGERTPNADGLEMNFAVNVAGVYALTELLMPALKRASPDACVISVASGGMYTENLTENLQYEDKKTFDGTAQYARNKRVQDYLGFRFGVLCGSTEGPCRSLADAEAVGKLNTASCGGTIRFKKWLLRHDLTTRDVPEMCFFNIQPSGAAIGLIDTTTKVALTEYWAEKHKDAVGFYSMHPGWVDTGGVKKSMPGFHAKFQTSMRTLDEGADTITWLSLQPRTKLQSGEFYFDRKVAPKHLPGCGTQYSPALVATVVSKVQSLCGL